MILARLACPILLAALLLVSLAGVVGAHASFVRSEPAADSVLQVAPEQVRIWFSEPLERGFSEVQVLDARGARVDRGDSRVLPEDRLSMVVSLQPLDKGTYTVAWKALSSVDGHVTRGAFTLSVGVAPSADLSPTPVEEVPAQVPFEAVVRWLSYLASAALVGALVFRLLVLDPVAERHGVAEGLPQVMADPLHRLLVVSWVALLVATLAALVLQVVALGAVEAPLPGVLGQLVVGTRYGQIWLLRLAFVIALGLILVGPHDKNRRLDWWLGSILGGAILLTSSLNSHSAAVGGFTAFAVLADWLHLVAVAVWVGGLFSLALVLPGGLKAIPSPQRWRLLAEIIPRFSALAVASVGVLIATGLYMAWLHVGSFGALLETLYGKSLMVKLGVATPLLLLGAANLLVIRPRLIQATAGNGHLLWAEQIGRHFRRLVRAEAILAVLVLLVAGALTSLPPGRQTYEQLVATRPLVMSAQARDLRLTLSIAPARPGPNTFTVLVHGPDGRPLDGAERVDLRFSNLDRDLGTNVEIAQPQGEGRYVTRGAPVGVEGRWQVELLVRRAGQEDLRTAFRFAVTTTSAEQIGQGAPSAGAGLSLPELSVVMLAALGLALVGVGLVVYVLRTVGLRSLEGAMLSLASVVVIGLGVFLAARVQPAGPVAPQDIRSLENPFAPTQESIAIGERIYRTQCQSCHGVNGHGDGPIGVTLNPRPADFREHLVAGHTDGELYHWVSDGVKGTAMPAFRDRLSEEERWHVLNFIKTFAPVDR